MKKKQQTCKEIIFKKKLKNKHKQDKKKIIYENNSNKSQESVPYKNKIYHIISYTNCG